MLEAWKARIASCAGMLTVLWLGTALAQGEDLHQEPTSLPQEKTPSETGSPPAVPGSSTASTAPQNAASPPPKSAETKPAEKKTESAAKKAKKEEHEPANPDTGASTLSGETLGLLPNPYEQQGIKFTLSYIADPLSNVSGGFKRGTVYEGRLNGAVDVDFAKYSGLRGLSFHANVFEIHGPALSRDFIGNLMPVSSLEAEATIRLYEAWLEQKFWNDKFSIRAGQLAADAEFITSRFANPMAATYGWPAIFALNMPSGGPAPPLAAMGVRLKAILNDNITLLGAVFDGNAAGAGTDSPESRDRYGVNFRIIDPPLVLAEAQFAYNQEKTSSGLCLGP
jgi:porin